MYIFSILSYQVIFFLLLLLQIECADECTVDEYVVWVQHVYVVWVQYKCFFFNNFCLEVYFYKLYCFILNLLPFQFSINVILSTSHQIASLYPSNDHIALENTKHRLNCVELKLSCWSWSLWMGRNFKLNLLCTRTTHSG